MGMTPQISALWGKLWETCHLNHSLGKRARYPRAIKSIVVFENSQCSWPKTSLGYCCRPAQHHTGCDSLAIHGPFDSLSLRHRFFWAVSASATVLRKLTPLQNCWKYQWFTEVGHDDQSQLLAECGWDSSFLLDRWMIYTYLYQTPSC
jgi:hypothetical protein